MIIQNWNCELSTYQTKTSIKYIIRLFKLKFWTLSMMTKVTTLHSKHGSRSTISGRLNHFCSYFQYVTAQQLYSVCPAHLSAVFDRMKIIAASKGCLTTLIWFWFQGVALESLRRGGGGDEEARVGRDHQVFNSSYNAKAILFL